MWNIINCLIIDMQLTFAHAAVTLCQSGVQKSLSMKSVVTSNRSIFQEEIVHHSGFTNLKLMAECCKEK